MEQNITRNDHYSLATQSNANSAVVLAYITVDTHRENSITDQALHHLYPDALLAGAGKFSREAFLNAVNLLGADIAVGITDGRLTLTLQATSAAFPKLLPLVQIMLTTPTFSATELERITLNVRNELHIKQEQSATIAREQLRNSFYKASDRRYTASDKEINAALETIDTTALHTFHTYVLSAPWSCSIAADESAITQFKKMITRSKNTIENSATVKAHEQKTAAQAVHLKQIPSKANIDFSIGIPLPITIHHPDYVPVTFALGVLGIPGFAGRLMSTVRDKEGLTYSIYAYAETFSGHEHGYARIMTFFTPEKTIQGLTATFREIKKFYEKGISQSEFETFQTIFQTRQTLLQDSLLKQLGDLHAFNQNGFSIEEMKHFKQQLGTITRLQVNTVIKTYFNPSCFTISGAGPIHNIEKEIREFASSVT